MTTVDEIGRLAQIAANNATRIDAIEAKYPEAEVRIGPGGVTPEQRAEAAEEYERLDRELISLGDSLFGRDKATARVVASAVAFCADRTQATELALFDAVRDYEAWQDRCNRRNLIDRRQARLRPIAYSRPFSVFDSRTRSLIASGDTLDELEAAVESFYAAKDR